MFKFVKKSIQRLQSCLKYSKSEMYKFGGIKLPPQAVCQEQYKTHLLKIMNEETISKLRSLYIKILNAMNHQNQQLMSQLVHDQMQEIRLPQRSKLLNTQDDVKLYFGDCVFGHLTIMNNYLGYKLNCFQVKGDINKFSVTFDKMPYQKTYIQDKIVNILTLPNNQEQTQEDQLQQNDILMYYLTKKYKISLQIFYESKTKLIPIRHAYKKTQSANKQIHQIRVQLQGYMNHLNIHIPQFYSQFMNDHSRLQSTLKQFVDGNNDNWKIVEMDNSHCQNFLLLR